MNTLLARTVLVLTLLAPASASAAAPQTFLQLSSVVVLLLNNATAVLIVAGIAIYFWGISTNILNFSEKGGEKVRVYFLWGIIILTVMVSIWGILRLLQSSLFGVNPYYSSGVPTSGTPSGDAFHAIHIPSH
jgi:hypothetical protein